MLAYLFVLFEVASSFCPDSELSDNYQIVQAMILPSVIEEIATLGKLLTQFCLSLPRSINGYLVGSYECRVWLPCYMLYASRPGSICTVN